ncbi:MAG: YicC family protein [Bacteroidetes bacterium HGW-Bacteroidetes-21]|nr:MAG: YicC family protein [Bacteroidetes bacterium HGW-Bacteroidetes-21]
MAVIQSMTGYGKSEKTGQKKKYLVEIRSLNSKQADINCRIPLMFREKEIEIRNLLNEKLVRGKIDFHIGFETSVKADVALNTDLFKSYYSSISQMLAEMNITPDTQIISSVLRFPDVIQPPREEFDEDEWKLVSTAIYEAIQNIITHRNSEGKALDNDLKKHVQNIQEKVKEVLPLGEQRKEQIRSRLSQSLQEISERASNDPNRFEQELIYYLEKMDFSEEITRLTQHCIYFFETMSEETPGRKLAFISQEMGREINTLGSKAYHSGIQKLVVEMKDELEKIKEQLLNIL